MAAHRQRASVETERAIGRVEAPAELVAQRGAGLVVERAAVRAAEAGASREREPRIVEAGVVGAGRELGGLHVLETCVLPQAAQPVASAPRVAAVIAGVRGA